MQQFTYFCSSQICPAAGLRPTQSASFPDTEYPEGGAMMQDACKTPWAKAQTHTFCHTIFLAHMLGSNREL